MTTQFLKTRVRKEAKIGERAVADVDAGQGMVARDIRRAQVRTQTPSVPIFGKRHLGTERRK